MSGHGHTPGPWRAESVGTYALPAYDIVAQVANRYGGNTTILTSLVSSVDTESARIERMQADALLMASAPDGLDANRTALTVLAMVKHGVATPEHVVAAIGKLEAAIAKATGCES